MNKFSGYLKDKELLEGIKKILSDVPKHVNKRSKVILVDEKTKIIDDIVISENVDIIKQSNIQEELIVDTEIIEPSTIMINKQFEIMDKLLPDKKDNELTTEEEKQFERLSEKLATDANFLQTFQSNIQQPTMMGGGGIGDDVAIMITHREAKNAEFDTTGTSLSSNTINDAIQEVYEYASTIIETSANLNNYYNKSEVNQISATLYSMTSADNNSWPSVSANYYTQTQIKNGTPIVSAWNFSTLLSSSPTWSEGKIFYDNVNKTLASYNDKSDVTLQIGQETHIRCVNKTGSIIANGTVVRINGSQGQRPTITPSIAQQGQFPSKTVGVTTHHIDNNEEGIVTTQGTVSDVTGLSGFTEGDELWLSPTITGGYTNTPPNAPTPSIFIGHVLSNHAVNGKILVDIQSNRKLEDLCNVNGTSAKNNWILAYNSSASYWDPTNKLNTSGGFFFGDVANNNFSQFQQNTGFLSAVGSACAWEDLTFPSTQSKQGANLKPDFDYTNVCALFPQNDTSEILYMIGQFPHAYKQGSDIEMHIHWQQASSALPVWVVQYSWYNIGDIVPAFTTISANSPALATYTSGTMAQITKLPTIVGTGKGISSMIKIKFYRNDNVVTGDVKVDELDIHYQRDTDGSRQEFIK